jgi:formate dehydrogenase subunit delta
MNREHLIKMANQIGAFFGAYPDQEDAVNQVANHLKSYWEPRMRREIIAYVQQTGGPALTDLVRKAVRSLDHGPEPKAPA